MFLIILNNFCYRRRLWIEQVDPSLASKSDYELSELRVCGQHFTPDKYLNISRKTLFHDAIPCLNLPTPPCPISRKVLPVAEAVSESAGTSNSSSAREQPSSFPDFCAFSIPVSGVADSSISSLASSSAVSCYFSTPVSGSADASSSSMASTSAVSCSSSTPESGVSECAIASFRSCESSTVVSSVLLSPISGTSKQNKLRRRRLLQELELNRAEVTPRKKRILELAARTAKRYNRLKRNVIKTRGRMKSLVKLADCSDMSYFLQNGVSPAAAALAAGDARNRHVRPKHRRWTRKEKLLALALYKRSPKAFRFLSSLIVLPSRSTLNSLLSELPFNVGINEDIIRHLGMEVRKMNQTRKGNEFCALYFDEISLRCGLFYRQNVDKVDGFEDYGAFGRTMRQADHALVFMARGLRKQWKQPVAYYFCQSSTPTDILEQLIVDVIESLFSAGLVVKAVVCDQGSTNRAALRNLLARFPAANNENFLFQVNGETVATVYDVPHLLKSLRNNFMKYVVQMGTETAIWDHLKLLLAANENCLYSLIRKSQFLMWNPRGKIRCG